MLRPGLGTGELSRLRGKSEEKWICGASGFARQCDEIAGGLAGRARRASQRTCRGHHGRVEETATSSVIMSLRLSPWRLPVPQYLDQRCQPAGQRSGTGGVAPQLNRRRSLRRRQADRIDRTREGPGVDAPQALPTEEKEITGINWPRPRFCVHIPIYIRERESQTRIELSRQTENGVFDMEVMKWTASPPNIIITRKRGHTIQ